MAAITLRDVQPSDLDTLFAHQLDDESNRMAAFTATDPTDRDAFDRRWERILADDKLTKKVILDDEKIVGSVFCHDWYGQPEVGYWIDRLYWGNGYATAGLRQLLDLVPERPLYAMVAVDNEGSKRVLEKCGFVFERTQKSFAEARGKEIDESVYVLAG
jgi:RimJ/RimL family protein N-acetyltransferase